MNGYTMMAETYKRAIANAEPGLDIESMNQSIKAFEFLATCSDAEICKLFDSSAFNEIMMSYVRTAVNSLECLDDEQKAAVRNEVRALLSEKSASEILQ